MSIQIFNDIEHHIFDVNLNCNSLTPERAFDEYLKRYKVMESDDELIDNGECFKIVSQGKFHLRYLKYAYINNPYHYPYRVEFFHSEQEANEFKHKMLMELISELKKYDNEDSHVDRECFVDDEIYNRLYRTREEKCKNCDVLLITHFNTIMAKLKDMSFFVHNHPFHNQKERRASLRNYILILIMVGV